jgi:phage head maturation protease
MIHPEAEWLSYQSNIEPRSMGAASRTIGGMVVPYLQPSQPFRGMQEVVERSFFRASEQAGYANAVSTYEHNPLMLLGTVASGTLRFTNTRDSLDFEVDLPSSRMDVYESVQRRDVTAASMEFLCAQDDFTTGDGGLPVRHLIDGTLTGVSPTARPVFSQTQGTVGLRSFSSHVGVPYEEVVEYAAKGELTKLLPDSGKRTVVDLAPARSVGDGGLEIAARRLEMNRRAMAFNGPAKPREDVNGQLDLLARRLELNRRKMDWDAPVVLPENTPYLTASRD